MCDGGEVACGGLFFGVVLERVMKGVVVAMVVVLDGSGGVVVVVVAAITAAEAVQAHGAPFCFESARDGGASLLG